MSNHDPENYYGSLSRIPDAGAEDVKATLRRLVKDFHPNSNPAGDATIGWFKHAMRGASFDALSMARGVGARRFKSIGFG
jgi:curved DNA-binding protein CbpA